MQTRGSLGVHAERCYASRGRGRATVEAGPTPAPWRSAPFFYYTARVVMDHPSGDERSPDGPRRLSLPTGR
jgi:hypothetical protein